MSNLDRHTYATPLNIDIAKADGWTVEVDPSPPSGYAEWWFAYDGDGRAWCDEETEERCWARLIKAADLDCEHSLDASLAVMMRRGWRCEVTWDDTDAYWMDEEEDIPEDANREEWRCTATIFDTLGYQAGEATDITFPLALATALLAAMQAQPENKT